MSQSENELIIARLKQIMNEYRAKSVRAFALSINTDPSFFAKILKGEKELTQNVADQIRSKYGVNADWLQTGKGEKAEPQHIQNLDQNKKPGSIDYQAKYIAGLEEDKAWLKRMLETSLAEILRQMELSSIRQKGTGDVVLRSLERLEGLKEDELVKEADRLSLQIDTEAHMRGSADVPHR
jgi:phage repressor protein C with HTH and peptisase S24 domain